MDRDDSVKNRHALPEEKLAILETFGHAGTRLLNRNVPTVRRPDALPTSVDRCSDGEWVLELPFTMALSLNDRMNHWVKAKRTKEWRDAACWLARAAKIPRCRQVAVELHYVPRDSRRRDEDNLVLAYKPCVDGLVDAGVVSDDTSEFVTRGWPQIHPKGEARRAGNRFWLVVTRLK